MASCELSSKQCVPCRGGVPPLKGDALSTLSAQVGHGWSVIDQHHLEKQFTLKNFKESLALTNAIGELSEQQGHHPVIELMWGKVIVRIWTHKIDGLTESDFILAAKIDDVFETRQKGSTL